MIAAIAAALYGLEDDRRTHRVLTPLERWRPWGGGMFGVELELQAGGRTLRIARDFERGTVSVFDERGREVTEEFVDGKDVSLGRLLLGVDSDEFEKCALVRQGDLDQVVPGDEKARRGFDAARAARERRRHAHRRHQRLRGAARPRRIAAPLRRARAGVHGHRRERHRTAGGEDRAGRVGDPRDRAPPREVAGAARRRWPRSPRRSTELRDEAARARPGAQREPRRRTCSASSTRTKRTAPS